MLKLPLVLVVFTLAIAPSWQHGFLYTPPSRSTAWRKGFDTPPNYSDNQLNCGGFGHQWGNNGGMCGECGDPYDLPLGQRPNQAGGMYATGTIVGTYTQGEVIDVTVQITAMHQGWYEFRLCAVNNKDVPATWECLNQNLLEFADGSTRYDIGSEGPGSYTFQVKLPADITCSQCVLQWMWHCGNSWGTNPDGESCVGCGPQEQFYGCADIAIIPSDGQPTQPTEGTTSDGVESSTVPSTLPSIAPDTTTTESTTSSTSVQTTTTTTQPPGGSCIWIGSEGAGTDEWCNENCYYVPPFCPEDMCLCA